MLDTLVNVKARLGIVTSDNDTFLTQQITLISDVIEAYCRRKFKAADWIQTVYRTELRDPRTHELYHYPVISLDTVFIDGTEMLEVDFDNIVVHKPTGRLRREDGGWIYGSRVVFHYRAGYEVVPSIIISVLDSLVQQRYNKKISGVDLDFGSDVQRISIPGAISIDFDYSLSNNERSSAYGSILGSSSNILDDWRSERAVLGSGKVEYVEEDVEVIP